MRLRTTTRGWLGCGVLQASKYGGNPPLGEGEIFLVLCPRIPHIDLWHGLCGEGHISMPPGSWKHPFSSFEGPNPL